MVDKLIFRISELLQGVENRIGLVLTSALIGLLLFAISLVYVHSTFVPQYHGTQFSLLSVNPFDFSYNNPLRYRILAPLIGYLFFLRGNNFIFLPLIFCFLFISSVYYHYRKKDYLPVDALIFSCLIAFSCVIFIPLFAPGYTDVVTCFFIFIAFIRIKNRILSAVFFALALLNHESALFLLPGLIFYSFAENTLQKAKHVQIPAVYFLACIPHMLYRLFVDANIHPLYTVGFYFSYSNIYTVVKSLLPVLIPAFFYAFKVFWLIPLVFIYTALKNQSYMKIFLILTILIGVSLQLVIAYDYTRMIVLAFPAILLSAEYIRSVMPEKFSKYSLVLILINFLVIQYQYNYSGAVKMGCQKSEIKAAGYLMINQASSARIVSPPLTT